MAYSQMGSGFSGWNTDTAGSSFEKEANILLSAFKKHRSVAFGLHDTAPAKTQVEGVRGMDSFVDSETPRAYGAGLSLSTPWR